MNFKEVQLSADQVRNLDAAVALIERVRSALDVTQEKCDHCERVSATNYFAYRLYLELGGVITRLKKYAREGASNSPVRA